MKIETRGANQTKFFGKDYTIFFSYNTPVACYSLKNGMYYKTDKKWSSTTNKHINSFLKGIEDKAIDVKPQAFFDKLLK